MVFAHLGSLHDIREICDALLVQSTVPCMSALSLRVDTTIETIMQLELIRKCGMSLSYGAFMLCVISGWGTQRCGQPKLRFSRPAHVGCPFPHLPIRFCATVHVKVIRQSVGGRCLRI